MLAARVNGDKVSINSLKSGQASSMLVGYGLTNSFLELGFDLWPRHGRQLY